MKKKAMTFAAVVTVSFILLLLFLVIGAKFIEMFGKAASDETKVDICRTSILVNAKTKEGSGDERFPINCPMREPLEIKYKDIKSFFGSYEAAEYNMMKILAEELSTVHYKSLGDMENVVPFDSDKGIYCIVDRKISFDNRIPEATDRNGEHPLREIDDFMTYLINTKDSKTKRYYSDYLYGYKKEDTSEEEKYSDLLNNMKKSQKLRSNQKLDNALTQISNSNPINMDINTTKDYYTVHVVLKDKALIKQFLGITDDLNNLGLACGSALVASYTRSTVVAGIPVVNAVSWTATAGLTVWCAGQIYKTYWDFSNEIDSLKLSFLVPVDKMPHLGCTERFMS